MKAVISEFEENFDDGELILDFAIYQKNHEISESLLYFKTFYPNLLFKF